MKEYIVTCSTHTLHGGHYQGRVTIYAEDEEQAAQLGRKKYWCSGFQDIWLSSIKVKKVERKF